MKTGSYYCLSKADDRIRPRIEGGARPAQLYNVLGNHHHSKKHEIKGNYERNSYVPEVVKRGCFI